jgi:hypothetical protein
MNQTTLMPLAPNRHLINARQVGEILGCSWRGSRT